jgi:hypothetical protein
MITQAVQNLFEFIGFLHDKKDYLLGKQPLIDKLLKLYNERNSLKPNDNYRDKIEYDKIQSEIEKQYDIVTNKTTNLIKDKIKELDIADISNPKIILYARADLFELKKSFDKNDLPIIFTAKNKYLDFRTATNYHYFLEFFFSDLDRELKPIFYFFSDIIENNFEAFEVKEIQVNNIQELVEQIGQGHKKFTLPNIFLTPSTFKQQSKNENLPPQLTEKKTKQEKPNIELPKIKPIFKPDSIPIIYDTLKNFFCPEDSIQLEIIIKTGEISNKPLLFLDNGNRLADAFKQLYNTDFITGCQKQELENWISKNFSFKNGNKVKPFTLRYLQDIISSKDDKCRKPILTIKKVNGENIINKV